MGRKSQLKQAEEKLKSQTGASLAIAMLYFLICAMTGAVVLASASSNLSHIKAEKRHERNYLAVMSAAELLKTQLSGCAGEWNFQHGEMDTAADSYRKTAFKQEMLVPVTEAYQGMAVKQALIQNIYQTYLNCLQDDKLQVPKDPKNYQMNLNIQLDRDTDLSGLEMPPVTAIITITPEQVVLNGHNYQQLYMTVKAELSIADGSAGQYLLSLHMGGVVHYTLYEETIETELEHGERKTSYQYTSQVMFSPDKPRISGGGQRGGNRDES